MLEYIDKNLLSECRHLTLVSFQKNKIVQIEPGSFDTVSSVLEHIDLSHNYLTDISNVLSNLSALSVVDLSDNRLRTLQDDAFDGSEALMLLNLDNNFIQVIPAALAKLPQLTDLSLIGNRLKTTVSPAIANGFAGLLRLYLTNNSISTLQVKQYPMLVGLHLENNQLESIPDDTFETNVDLKTLYLANNRIMGSLDRCFLPVRHLERLQLDSNPLGHISASMFSTLTQLETLMLKNTSLTELRGSPFASLNKLSLLDLSENQIGAIGSTELKGLDSLDELYLNNNEFASANLSGLSVLDGVKLLTISYGKWNPSADLLVNKTKLEDLYMQGAQFSVLPNDFFIYTTKLSLLSISDNKQFNRLPSTFFQHIPYLKELTLVNNSLSTLEQGVFDYLGLLEELYIRDNPLRTLRSDLFAKTYSMKTLEISEANLTSLPTGLFDSLNRLKKLDLDSNQLSNQLTNVTFHGLYSLEILLLQDNGIERLSPGVFDDLVLLQEVYLGHNKLSSLDSRLFANLRHMMLLDLPNNKFSTFDLTTLSFASPLPVLNLDNNGLKTIKITPTLNKLSVDNNELSSIEVDQTDESISMLIMLSASHNRFTTVEAFTKFPAMSELDVSFNRFETLDLALLTRKMFSLIELNASDSYVKHLGVTYFQPQFSLIHLDISNNNLTRIRDLGELRYPFLENIILGGNQFERFLLEEVTEQFQMLRMIGLEGNQGSWSCELIRGLDLDRFYLNLWRKPELKEQQQTCAKQEKGICCL
ncbi:protein artichoke-like [Anopheles darlingi]|uniref:protein artichoke-like n=1 Tax=Anopheles darlingi TaxID=43151 RepID=UPI002100179A|nr:protein artichoke-like [Anopheles darlingi]